MAWQAFCFGSEEETAIIYLFHLLVLLLGGSCWSEGGVGALLSLALSFYFCSMCANIMRVALTIGAYLCPDFDTGHCTGLLCSVLVAAMSYVATWCGVGIGLADSSS